MELRIVHGAKKGRHLAAVWRFLASEPGNNPRLVPDTPFARVLFTARWKYLVQQDRPGKGVTPDPRPRGRRPKDHDRHPFRLLRVHSDAIRLEKRGSDITENDGRGHTGCTWRLCLLRLRPRGLQFTEPTCPSSVAAVRGPPAFWISDKRGKVMFGVRELDFLGHHVMSDGIRPLADKVGTVTQYKTPKTVRSLQCFLGVS